MNLNSAEILLPSLENMFGQVHGWTLPRTIIKNVSIEKCAFYPDTNIIDLGAFKCTPAVFAFVWFHEAHHFVQFTLEKRPLDTYYKNVNLFKTDAEYIWITEEREANLAAYEMCKRMGLTDFLPYWIPAGYFD